MSAITFSVIIAAPELSEEIPVWQSLRSGGALEKEGVPAPKAPIEIWVAAGRNPSAQRNAAAREAKGTWLVFFDSDCEIPPDYFVKLDEIIRCERPEVVGGPVLLKEPASGKERLFQELFSYPAVTGPSASRYASRGERRETTERELILCNLAIKRELWDSLGGFNERLFPNEENEWMERAVLVEATLVHDPELTVARPQRKSWKELGETFIRYGKGRAKQTVVSRRLDAARFIPLCGILGWLMIVAVHGWIRGILAFFLGWLAFTLWIYFFPDRPEGRFRMLVALGAPGMILAYGWGQAVGLGGAIFLGTKAKSTEVEVKCVFSEEIRSAGI